MSIWAELAEDGPDEAVDTMGMQVYCNHCDYPERGDHYFWCTAKICDACGKDRGDTTFMVVGHWQNLSTDVMTYHNHTNDYGQYCSAECAERTAKRNGGGVVLTTEQFASVAEKIKSLSIRDYQRLEDDLHKDYERHIKIMGYPNMWYHRRDELIFGWIGNKMFPVTPR